MPRKSQDKFRGRQAEVSAQWPREILPKKSERRGRRPEARRDCEVFHHIWRHRIEPPHPSERGQRGAEQEHEKTFPNSLSDTSHRVTRLP